MASLAGRNTPPDVQSRTDALTRTREHQYAATGFFGNGLTLGTVSAMVISDAICNRKNPWGDLFGERSAH
jgi:glycine/D-amino acid oxidase-like deaminating enzyme